MDIFRIVGLGIAAAVMSVFLKNWRAEIAVLVSLVASVVLFFMIMPYLESVLEMFQDISNQIGVDVKFIGVIIRVVGVAYIAQFGAELCRDAGENAVASKIEFGGKVMIVALSMPVLYSFLDVVNSIIRFG